MDRFSFNYSLKLLFLNVFLLVLFFLTLGCRRDQLFDLTTSENISKPWTRWWWMGNSVTKKGITQHLEAFNEIGLGGVEIVPIYGEKGDEENFIPYLSGEWIDIILYTLREADRLNLGVDMTLGSGWPYGGPWITDTYAARRYNVHFIKEGVLTGQSVKRAAPGAHGLVVDHFNPDAMQYFLSRFDSLMTIIKKENLPLRAVFNDSYEVYGADWTSNFKEKFHKKRGYPFPDELFVSDNSTNNEMCKSWQDYHNTISDLVYETVGTSIIDWCNTHDLQYRYQAHGSPSNILDLYGIASIPETECFGSSKFNIPMVHYDEDYDELRFGRPHPLIYKFASSPAHTLGKLLVSSETATWLADHFKVSLSQVKPQVDELFASGINHIFYHGITYSPFEKDFPGRLFYASTNFSPKSALWNYLGNLNDYISNCQSILQKTMPDNDILLYFPVYDLWNSNGNDGNLIMQSVHNPQSWFFNTSFGKTAQKLYDAGYAFDYISDKQIAYFANTIDINTNSYKTLIIPASKCIPLETIRNLKVLHSNGIQIQFIEMFPGNVPGKIANLSRSTELKALIQETNFDNPVPDDIDSISYNLRSNEIYPESITQKGMSFIRKSYKNGYVYFISNLGSNYFDGFCSLAREFKSVEIYDPLSDLRGKALIKLSDERKEVRLQIDAGQSLFLITYNNSVDQNNWKYQGKKKGAIDLKSNWTLRIEDPENGYYLKDHPLDSLISWTRLPFPWAPYYSGSATYTVNFDFPINDQEIDAVILDLGDLRYMATVSLNGHNLGKFWSVPFQKTIPIDKFESRNTLTVNVTNLDANQVIQLDKAGIPWKNFYDINFVDIRYEPFDASSWEPMPSGLPGPVRLITVDLE